MSAVQDYLRAQLSEALEKATGLSMVAFRVTDGVLDVSFTFDGPGAESLFWRALREAHEQRE